MFSPKYLVSLAVCFASLNPAAAATKDRVPHEHAAVKSQSLQTRSSPAQFERLLDRRNAAEASGTTDKVGATDADIRDRFEHPLAIMITDMTGFTRRTQTRGIISFLGQVRRLKLLAQPVLAKHGAWLIKMDADDLFVAHKDPAVLLAVARDLQAAVRDHNARYKDDIGLSVGLGYGPTLVIGNDVFGNSVNTSSKLGEDTGKDGDILASGDFVSRLAATADACAPVKGDGELSFAYFRCR